MAQQCGQVDLSGVESRLAALESSVGKLDARIGEVISTVNRLISLAEKILQEYGRSLDKILGVVQSFHDTLKSSLAELPGLIRAAIRETGETVREIVLGALNRMYDFLRDLFGKGSGKDEEVLRLISSMLSSLQGLKGKIDGLGSKIDGLGSRIDGIREAIGSLKQFIGNQLAQLLNALEGSLRGVRDAIGDIRQAINQIRDDINSELRKLGNAMAAGFREVKGAINEAVAAILFGVGAVTTAILAAITGALKAILAAIAASAAVDRLGDILNKLASALSILQSILSLLGRGNAGGSSPDISRLEGLLSSVNQKVGRVEGKIDSLKTGIERQFVDLLNALWERLNPEVRGTVEVLDCAAGVRRHAYSGRGIQGLSFQLEALGRALMNMSQSSCPEIKSELVLSNCQNQRRLFVSGGRGFAGLSNQVRALGNALIEIQKSVCESGFKPEPISGVIEITDCDGVPKRFGYGGNNFRGLSFQVTALSRALNEQNKILCGAVERLDELEGSATPLMPGEYFEELPVPTQLVLTFGTEYPTQRGSLWHMSIPAPVDHENLDWVRDFQPIQRTIGKIQVRSFWQGTSAHVPRTIWTGGWFSSLQEAESFFEQFILPLTTLNPLRDDDGKYLRSYAGKKPKRQPRNRLVRCVRAVWVRTDPSTNEPVECFVFRPGRSD